MRSRQAQGRLGLEVLLGDKEAKEMVRLPKDRAEKETEVYEDRTAGEHLCASGSPMWRAGL